MAHEIEKISWEVVAVAFLCSLFFVRSSQFAVRSSQFAVAVELPALVLDTAFVLDTALGTQNGVLHTLARATTSNIMPKDN